ncbi:hypothetical protein HO173_013357 [Letharia columbiana]|uniref:GPN-loop GTPase 2 n=1 Tax=Letharia columbiana TaxID=112416 RepID=A0A8H6CFP8_9LECA|nr:uncharacterized protein HO173_013357 [Letharia columbiana]KAF6222548.1 hypothetical protein HO173_013357 [Letharia columbiana]
MPFAQLIIGPPGSGKSTYCDGMQQFLSAIGRKCSVVNLDPANDRTSYPCALDVRDLVTLEEVMAEEGLGPNGGVLYALEELEHNGEWLDEGLRGLGEDYVLFDCPGQVELFTHHSSLRNLFFRIQKLGYRLVALHLTDSYCLTLPSLYISTLLLSLRAMLQMDLPHLNVMTKIDKLASYGPLPFNLDFYTEVQDLSYLLPHLANENPVMRHPKFEGLNNAVVELVEDFGLVGFETLAVEDKKSMMTLLQAIDRAGGYAFGGAEGANDTVWQVAMREGMTGMTIHDVQERWIDRKEEFDELEAKEREEEARAQETPPLTEDGGEEDSDVEEMGPVPDSGVKVLRRS